MATSFHVSPGQWIRVPVAGDAWPARMQIGDSEPEPAFVDHVRGRRGGIETHAKRRCPELRPGQHKVRVTTPDQTVEITVTIV